MNIKQVTAAFFAAGLAFAVQAQEAAANSSEAEETSGLSWTPGDGISYGETKILSAEFGLAFDSKYLTYGVVDGKDPIVTPSATVTFFDWLYFGCEAIYDVTKGNGKRWGYGRRTGRPTTIDGIVGLAHDFDLGDTLGALSVDVNYIYEYFRRYSDGFDKYVDDTQYINLELSLGDLWFEPKFAVERDIMADDGTYFNFEVGHTFAIVGGETEEDDPVLTLRPAIGQGFGNTRRVRLYGFMTKDYNELDHGGLMDTSFSLTAEWAICDCLTLSAYVAYYDFLFDSNMREGARVRNSLWSEFSNKYADSYQFVGGLSLTASF